MIERPFWQRRIEDACPLPVILDDDADYEAISLVLMSPEEHSPSELIETLEMLKLLADPQCNFDFEQSAGETVDRLREPDDAAGDLAIKLLREAPDVAWQIFDRRALGMPRSLTSYISSAPLREPTPARLDALERLMAPWFESNDPDDSRHWLHVYPDRAHGHVAISDECPPHREPLPLKAEDLCETTVDVNRLRPELATALAFVARSEVTTAARDVHQLGIAQPTKGRAVPVLIYLPRGLTEPTKRTPADRQPSATESE